MVTALHSLDDALKRIEEASDKRAAFFEELAALPHPSIVREDLKRYRVLFATGPYLHEEFLVLSPVSSSSVPRPPSKQQVEADARIEAAQQAHKDAQQALHDAWRAAVAAKVGRWGGVEMSDGGNAGQFAWRPEEQRKGLDAAFTEHFDRVAEAHAAIQSAERNIDEVRAANTRALRRGDGFLPGIRRIIGGRE